MIPFMNSCGRITPAPTRIPSPTIFQWSLQSPVTVYYLRENPARQASERPLGSNVFPETQVCCAQSSPVRLRCPQVLPPYGRRGAVSRGPPVGFRHGGGLPINSAVNLQSRRICCRSPGPDCFASANGRHRRRPSSCRKKWWLPRMRAMTNPALLSVATRSSPVSRGPAHAAMVICWMPTNSRD
jgi:hypothetical protein